MNDRTDRLYSEFPAPAGSFKFDARVAHVFDDMIKRSVPGYSQIISLLPTLARQFQQSGKNYYDLGCSTGAGLFSLASGITDKTAKLIGIDNSQAMLEEALKISRQFSFDSSSQPTFHCADVVTAKIENAAMVLLNFTLQFIPLEHRRNLINQIYRGLESGGVLVLSEKITADSPDSQELLTRIHHQYKADQGYSKLEISNKRDAIEHVLIPESLAVHMQRLQEAGFNTVTPWIRNLQFVSILAVK